jgi:hypothetical protein
MKKTITAIQAENLAISYKAFTTAVENQNAVASRVWARLLKKAQEETGIELSSLEVLDFHSRPGK